MNSYLLGAFEARGNIGIQRQQGGGSIIGRIQVETRYTSAILEEFFGGPPQVLKGYAVTVYRYTTASPERGRNVTQVLLDTGAHPRLAAELSILRDFYSATDESEQVKCMDALRSLRATKGRKS